MRRVSLRVNIKYNAFHIGQRHNNNVDKQITRLAIKLTTHYPRHLYPHLLISATYTIFLVSRYALAADADGERWKLYTRRNTVHNKKYVNAQIVCCTQVLAARFCKFKARPERNDVTNIRYCTFTQNKRTVWHGNSLADSRHSINHKRTYAKASRVCTWVCICIHRRPGRRER